MRQKGTTDVNHANIIGNSIENLLITDESLKDYAVKRLNLNENVPNKNVMDEAFLSSVKQELKEFDIERMPQISYKKNVHTSISV